MEENNVKDLLKSVKKGCRSSLIKLLTDHKYNPTQFQNEHNETLLHLACRNGHYDIMRTLIEMYHCDLVVVDRNGNSPFHTACESNQLKIAAYLCHKLNFLPCAHINHEGNTVLHVACKTGSVPMVKLILSELFLDLMKNVEDQIWKYRKYLCQEDIFRVLFSIHDFKMIYSHFNVISMYNSDGYNPVHLACRNGHLSTIKYFFTEFRMCLGCCTSLLECVPSLLSIACDYRHTSIIEFLYTQRDINTPLCDAIIPMKIKADTSRTNYTDFFISHFNRNVHKNLRTSRGNICTEGESSLFFAVRHADKVLFNHLTTVSWGKTFQMLNSNHDTLFHAACFSCDIEMVHMVRAYLAKTLKDPWDHLSKRNKQGNTCLHLACEWGSLAVAKYLIEVGFKINEKNSQGDTPLHICIQYERLEIFDYLLSDEREDVDINSSNELGETPLHIASFNPLLHFAEEIISHPKFNSIDTPDISGETPLFNACHAKKEDVISKKEDVISKKEDVISKKEDVISKKEDVISKKEDVISKKEDVISKKEDVISKKEDVISKKEDVISKKEDVISKKEDVIPKKEDVISFLLSKNCDLLCVNIFGETVLNVVLRLGLFKIAGSIFEVMESYPSKLQNYFGQTLLHIVCTTGDVKIVKSLAHYSTVYALSEDINLIDKVNELTPLQCACMQGNVPLFEYLLNEVPDCDPDTKNKDGDTVLHICCKNNFSQMAKICKDHSSITIRNELGDTPLHVACKDENYDLVLSLLEDTDVKNLESCCNLDGDSLLHIAAGKDGALKVVMKLVETGICSHTAKNMHTGNTALHVAFSKGVLKNAEYLLDKQARDKISWYNADDESPLCLAVRNKQYFFLEAILKPSFKPWFLQKCITVRHPFGNVLKEEYITMPLPHYLIYSVIKAHEVNPQVTPYDQMPHYVKERSKINSCELLYKFLDFILVHNLCGDLCALLDSRGCSLLHYLALCKCEHFRKSEDKLLTNNLCSIQDKKSKQTPLHLACFKANERMIYNILQLKNSYQLLHAKNAFGETPPDLYEQLSPNCTNFLLACGADMKLKKENRHGHNPEDTKTSNIGVIVVGNSAAGKTTLICSLKKMLTNNRNLKHELNPTTGIVTDEIKSFKTSSNSYIFYDFAGQVEFETSHSVRLDNILSSAAESASASPFVFLLMVKGNEPLSENELHINKWFSFVQSHVQVNNKNIHVALVCSHDDLLNDTQRSLRKNELKECLKVLSENKQFTKINVYETPILLNGLKTDTGPLNKLLRYLEDMFLFCKPSCLSNVCQELSNSLKAWFPQKPCQVKDLVKRITDGRKFSLQDDRIAVSSSHYSRLLPNESNKLVDLLKELNIKNHIVLLMQSEEKLNWWIINKNIQDTMFSKVISVFSPRSFRDTPNHLPITHNTGVIPTEKLSKIFSELSFPIDLIESYLISMEYCKLIEDEAVLHLITGTESTAESNRYFFFPGLIKKNKQDLPKSKFQYNYGWVYEKHIDLRLRFLHSLLLSLTFKFPPKDTDSGSKYERRLALWKNGLFWCTVQGIDVMVEVIDERKVVALFRCNSEKQLMPLAKYRSDVIAEIEKVLKRCNPDKTSTGLEYSILHPSPTDFNGDLSVELLHSKESLKKIWKCMCSEEPDSRSLPITYTERVPLHVMFGYDSYMLLELSTLRDLQKQLKTTLSPQTFLEVCSQLGAEALARILEIRISENMLEEFIEKHGDESVLTLCSHLNNYSIFQLQDLSF